jgi:hypothetical protein
MSRGNGNGRGNGHGNGGREAGGEAGFLIMPFSDPEDVEYEARQSASLRGLREWWDEWMGKGMLAEPDPMGSVVTRKGWRQLAEDEQVALDAVVDWFKDNFSSVRVLGKDREGNIHGQLVFDRGDPAQRALVDDLSSATIHASELEPDPTSAMSDFGRDLLDMQVRILAPQEAEDLRQRVTLSRSGN